MLSFFTVILAWFLADQFMGETSCASDVTVDVSESYKMLPRKWDAVLLMVNVH